MNLILILIFLNLFLLLEIQGDEKEEETREGDETKLHKMIKKILKIGLVIYAFVSFCLEMLSK